MPINKYPMLTPVDINNIQLMQWTIDLKLYNENSHGLLLHSGALEGKEKWGSNLCLSPLPFPPLPFPPPYLPSIPPSLLFPFPQKQAPLNPARVFGKHCKLPQRGPPKHISGICKLSLGNASEGQVTVFRQIFFLGGDSDFSWVNYCCPDGYSED